MDVLEPTNQAPVANAGPDQRVPVIVSTGKAQVVLTGAGSKDVDVDDDDLTFSWKEGTVPLSSFAVTTQQLSFGSHTLTLTVTDSKGAVSTDSVNAVVDNFAPVVAGGNAIYAGTATLVGTYSDANGDTMSCTFSGTCGLGQGNGCVPFSGTGGTSPSCKVRIKAGGPPYCNHTLNCTDPSGAYGTTLWHLQLP